MSKAIITHRTHLTIDTEMPAGIHKAADVALVLVGRAEAAAKLGHSTGQHVSACFGHCNQVYAVYTTPSGRLRYQVGPMGQPTGNSTYMLATIAHNLKQQRAAEEKNARRVPMQADTLYIEGHEVSVTLKGTRLLYLKGTYNYYHVGAIPRGQSGRQVTGGPLVPGPWAFAFQRATVLSDSEAFRNRDTAERMDAIPVEAGSLIWIDGVEYRVDVEREFINLTAI
jgi:hypothetical protein